MSSSGMNGIPGANAMGDTLEFVKNLWGSMKIPGMAMPSMSPEEIDKQIADLKAVESWLQMNMNMLRGSIQALEVQSATLSALRSMSETFAHAASGVTGASGAAASAADGKPHFESPFASARSHEAEPADELHESHESHESSALHAGQQADPAGMAAPFANPAVWWNAVQDQFQQAVSQAIAPAPAKKSARKTSAAKKKPAASKDAAGSAGISGGAKSASGARSTSSTKRPRSADSSGDAKQGSTTRRRRKPGESA